MKNGVIVDVWGDKWWYKDGLLHREDGPAIERANGDKSWYLNDLLHREDGPAVIGANGLQYWYFNGELHREDGPAWIGADDTQCWYLNGQRHREDGPARVWDNGTQEWWVNGQLHREDGPARIYANGTQEWWVNGEVHREDGPAFIGSRGRKSWWLNGVKVTEQIVMRPETITLAQIQKSRNNEVRSIMIERYGWHRFLADSNAKMIDKRENAVENTKEALFFTRSFGKRLVVTCPTGRVFTLGVPSDIVTCKAAQQWLGNSTEEINVIGRT